MNRRSFIRNAMAAVALTCSGLRLAQAEILKLKEIPLMALTVGDHRVFLYEGDNEINEGPIKGTATIEDGTMISLKHFDLQNDCHLKARLEVFGPLSIDCMMTVKSIPYRGIATQLTRIGPA